MRFSHNQKVYVKLAKDIQGIPSGWRVGYFDSMLANGKYKVNVRKDSKSFWQAVVVNDTEIVEIGGIE